MLLTTRDPRFLNRVLLTRTAIWAWGLVVPKRRNVLAVLATDAGRLLIPAANIVTDAGDIHYAQRGAGEAVTNAFGIHEMCSAGTPGKAANRSDFTAIGSSQKAHAGGYPKTDEDDADNDDGGPLGGPDVVTFLVSYAKADFSHGAISHGIITNTSPGASEPILTGYAFGAPFEKTSNDTLKVFVNHTKTGV